MAELNYAATRCPLSAKTLSAANVMTSLGGVRAQPVDCGQIGDSNVPALFSE